MIDHALRHRVAPYFAGTEQPTLQGVLNHLQMVNSEFQEGEVCEPDDPRVIAIEAYLQTVPPAGDPLQLLIDDIETVEVLIAAWGNEPLK